MAKPELVNHRKFVRLRRLLKAPAPHVLGYLEFLWQQGYQTGNPNVGDSGDVETAVEYQGEPGTFTAAAVEAGFLEANTDGTYTIHDLYEHAPKYVKMRMVRRGTAPTEALPSVKRTKAYPHKGTRRSKGVPQNQEPKTKNQEPRESPPTPPPDVVALPPAKFNPLTVPLPFAGSAFRLAWGEWVEHRRVKRETLTESITRKQLTALAELREPDAVACLENSLRNGYLGIFPEKFKANGRSPPFRSKAEISVDEVAEQFDSVYGRPA